MSFLESNDLTVNASYGRFRLTSNMPHLSLLSWRLKWLKNNAPEFWPHPRPSQDVQEGQVKSDCAAQEIKIKTKKAVLQFAFTVFCIAINWQHSFNKFHSTCRPTMNLTNMSITRVQLTFIFFKWHILAMFSAENVTSSSPRRGREIYETRDPWPKALNFKARLKRLSQCFHFSKLDISWNKQTLKILEFHKISWNFTKCSSLLINCDGIMLLKSKFLIFFYSRNVLFYPWKSWKFLNFGRSGSTGLKL